MFWHNFKYKFLSGIRVKEILFWLILFPMALGLFFKLAFSNLYENTELFSSIPIAVVETTEQPVLRTALEELESDGRQMFMVTYATEEEAYTLLEEKKVDGILYAGETLSLQVTGNGTEQTMIKLFAEQYQLHQTILKETIQTAPEKTEVVLDALQNTVVGNRAIAIAKEGTDPYSNYFYNLLAMVAMYGSIIGLHVAVQAQGNLSALGARKCCAPMKKWVGLLAALLGSDVLQASCMVVAVTYLIFVLKISFTGNLVLIYLSAMISGFFGISFGFLIGSIGTCKVGLKTGIAMAVSMLSCFFSGLMVANIRPFLEEKIPLFHSINPASLICDLFYCLEQDQNYERYLVKLLTILGMTVFFTILGFLITRRQQYASLSSVS